MAFFWGVLQTACLADLLCDFQRRCGKGLVLEAVFACGPWEALQAPPRMLHRISIHMFILSPQLVVFWYCSNVNTITNCAG